jgi:hypothetical protein
MVAEAEERRLVDRGHEPHVAPVSAVPTIGPAPVDMGLAPPRHRSGSPVAGPRVQLSLIDETCHIGLAYGYVQLMGLAALPYELNGKARPSGRISGKDYPDGLAGRITGTA